MNDGALAGAVVRAGAEAGSAGRSIGGEPVAVAADLAGAAAAAAAPRGGCVARLGDDELRALVGVVVTTLISVAFLRVGCS